MAAERTEPTAALKPADADGPPSSSSNFEQVDHFKLQIQGGLLDNLGIKMYTRLGKVLVEFAANAYDSDSAFVDIKFDFEAIAKAREQVRQAALSRFAAEAGSTQRKARIIIDPLPDDLTVIIGDHGHGMTPKEVADRFLPLNRNRRRAAGSPDETQLLSEAGKRLVMGRKGIGKLSAFGAASTVKVVTKRCNQPFWTEIILKSEELLNSNDLANVPVTHSYISATEEDIEKHGTRIELSGLRCDSVAFSIEELQSTLGETFYPIKAEEFSIRINGSEIKKPEPELEYWWPEDIAKDGLKNETLKSLEWGEIDLSYRVQFRKKSLPAEKRGVYIYAKKRLTMEPSLLQLNTGTHNFLANAYMECIVESDDIDNLNIDVIGTNRAGIIQNSDLVRSFLNRVTDIMTLAIKGHAAHREKVADEKLDQAPEAKTIRDILAVVPSGQRRAAKQLARIFVTQYGVDTEEFKSVAPLIMGTINAGEVLVDLIKVSNSPTTLSDVAEKLVRLREIERSDALKSFQGRRNGIIALRKIVEAGEDAWVKGPQNERDLHNLLKDNPWLIRPELAKYVSSDRTMGEVLDRLAREMQIGSYAPADLAAGETSSQSTDKKEVAETTRPDLVSLIGNGAHPDRVFVIELKSTALPLRIEHLGQLERYMRKVRDYFAREYAGSRHNILVEGALIGAMPAADTTSDPQLDLLERIRNKGLSADWEVIGVNELLRRTEAVHRELIESLRKEDQDEMDNEVLLTPLPA